MTHDEANELLAALALDAVSDEERTAVEEHVAQCPRCRSELDGLREVAAALGNSVATLPEGLWPSISKRIYEHQNGDENQNGGVRLFCFLLGCLFFTHGADMKCNWRAELEIFF